MFEDAAEGRLLKLQIISNNVRADVNDDRYSLLPRHSSFSGTILIWEVEA
jgi:hypothetical protein